MKSFIFAGMGGQGLILCGTLLGEAAVLHEGKKATMISAYGVETRGTFTKSELIIDDENIDFPEVERPDIVLTLTRQAYELYAPTLKDNTLLLYDSACGKEIQSKARQIGYPIFEEAERRGNAASANILSLGLIIGLTGTPGFDSTYKVLCKRFKANPKASENNIVLFETGYKAGGKL